MSLRHDECSFGARRITMKLLTRITFVVPASIILATSGATAALAAEESEQAPTECEGLKKSDEAADTSNAKPEEQQAADPYGPLAIIGGALQKICLTDEQKSKIEKLGDKVMPKEEAVSKARRALRDDLVEQLKSGKVDDAALDDAIDDLVDAREEASPVLRKALKDLHGILDPGQRKAFVEAIGNRMKELKAGSGGMLDDLAKDLGLNDDQKHRIRVALDTRKAEMEDASTVATKVFDAFKKDDFDLDKIVPEKEVGDRTRKGAEGMVDVTKKLVDILTPDQRTKLADKIERMQQQHEQKTGTSSQSLVVSRGAYRAGAVRGWGGAYSSRTYVAGGVRTGYAAGYPIVGYGPVYY
jgi:Spy/CpxP family protein refolding chaperone